MIILPSLEIVPAKYNTSTNTLLSQIPIDGTGDFSVTRATSATRVNGNGLIEVARTNLAFNSQTWDASNNWQLSESSGRVTVATATSGTLAPDGTSTANAITPTSANITHYLFSNATGTINYVSGAVYTISAFFKKGAGDSGRYVQITGRGGGRFVGDPYANFDLELGTTLTVSGSVADSNRVSRIQDFGNGWYRCSLTATCTATAASTVGVLAALLTADTNARLGAAFAGNTSDYIFGWGAQLEEGSFASEYIPTTTVARTTFAGVTVDGTAAANIPRLDYLQPDGTIGCPALLVEPSAQNLAFNSQTWASANNWRADVSGNITTVTGAIASPDGTMTANAISPTAVSGSHGFASLGVTFASGTNYTASAFFKQGTGVGRFVQITYTTAMNSGAGFANFDLQLGTVTASGGTGNVAARIENYGNGWYRCAYTATCNQNAANALGFLGTLIPTSGATRSPSFLGVTGDVLYGWGAQVETGSVATSYIPTTVSGVTRAADLIIDTTASGVIGQSEGTIYAEVDVRNITAGKNILSTDDGSTNNRVGLFVDPSPNRLTVIMSNSGTQTVVTGSITTGVHKIAVSYASGDVQIFLNGGFLASGVPAAFPTVTRNNLSIGGRIFSGVYGAFFNDRIRAVALYQTRLTNTQLALLTSPYTSYSSMASALSYTLG